MSGNTEFQRALKRLQQHKARVLQWLQWYIFPLFRLRVIRGVIIGNHYGPLPHAKITLNGWRTVYSDEKGQFTFKFILRRINYLTVEWHEAELINWITVDSTRQRVSKLKLKWPLLIRGQVVDEHGQGLTNIAVGLNHNQVTKTDAHGTFIFPLDEAHNEETDHLVFQFGKQSYVHRFKSNPKAHLLHRFMLGEGGLFHLEDRPSAQAVSQEVNRLAQLVRQGMWMTIALTILYLTLNFVVTKEQQENEQSLVQALTLNLNHSEASKDSVLNKQKSFQEQLSMENSKRHWDHAGLLERKNTKHTQQEERSLQNTEPPLRDELAHQYFASELETSTSTPQKNTTEVVNNIAVLEASNECLAMEFTYYSYYVPKGMEGILLSLVFGQWQSWRDELSPFNGLDRHHQLQAGQRVKLKLPLHTWALYKHQDDQSFESLLAQGQCDESSYKLCLQLLQAWNPHLHLRRLRKKDQLLVNLQLLKTRPFEGATLSRIEKLRRSAAPRRKYPRLKLEENCKLPTSLHLDVK